MVDAPNHALERDSYDAWGMRRNADGTDAPACNLVSSTKRGFTNQEMIDALCLVNLNASVYDPVIGRFLSADDVVDDPTNLQHLNRYSYVNNNPLSFTDPTGHDGFSMFNELGMVSLIGGVGDLSSRDGSVYGDGTNVFQGQSSSNPSTGGSASTKNTPTASDKSSVMVSWSVDGDPNTNDKTKKDSSQSSTTKDVKVAGLFWDTPAEKVQQARNYFEANGVETSKMSDAEVMKWFKSDVELERAIVQMNQGQGNPETVGKGWARNIPLQTGDNTISERTAKVLGFDNRRDTGRALELLKKDNNLRNDFHGQIMMNGDFRDPHTGHVYGNLRDYAPRVVK